MKTKKEKLKQNNMSSQKMSCKLKKTGLEIKIMKEAKKLEIGTEKNAQKKNFLRSKNYISVAKTKSVE